MKPLTRLRELSGTGLRDDNAAWTLITEATELLPDDPRIPMLRVKVVDLLEAIEIEIILGGEWAEYREQLKRLLDWIEKQAELRD